MSKPDWENFAKAVLADWPTYDLDGFTLFELSLQYGMIKEVAGGYNPDHHIDAEGICPQEGDPWYEYTFRGEAGAGLYSIADMNKRIEELEAENARLKADKATALEALQVFADDANWFDTPDSDGVTMNPTWRGPTFTPEQFASDVIAELTGGKDD